MALRTITFLSDYGLADEFVGVCHGVIADRCPDARVIDISHAVPPQDVRAGALMLHDALAYMPAGVHLAIVDPTVGASGAGSRRAVALLTASEGNILVGPDNGLLWPAAQLLGGVVESVDIGHSPERRLPVSATFHGRDIFSPVAAALAAGASLASVGEPIEGEALHRLSLPRAHLDGDVLVAHVLRSDHFGNLVLDASREQLHEAGLRPGGTVAVELAGRVHQGRSAVAFADVGAGELLLYTDAVQRAALAVNRGSAAAQLGAGRDDELRIRPA